MGINIIAAVPTYFAPEILITAAVIINDNPIANSFQYPFFFCKCKLTIKKRVSKQALPSEINLRCRSKK